MGQKSSEHTGGACKMEHVCQRTHLCKCVSTVWGGNRVRTRTRRIKGFVWEVKLCSELFTKVMCCAPHSYSLAQPHHFCPCLTCSELANSTTLPRNLLSALHWS